MHCMPAKISMKRSEHPLMTFGWSSNGRAVHHSQNLHNASDAIEIAQRAFAVPGSGDHFRAAA